MISHHREIMDGHHVQWLTNETKESVRAALNRGDYDGVGFNPYKGWDGDLTELLSENLAAKALVLPFADRVGFSGELLSHQRDLEMLLLSEFSGIAHIQGETFQVLRLLLKPGITIGGLRSLHTLYLREPTLSAIQQLPYRAPNLATLQLNGGSLSSIEGIETLGELKRVELLNFNKLKSLSSLAKGLHLHTLIIESLRGVNDLERTLGMMKSLRVLRLIDCGTIDSFSFLNELNLVEFRCSRTKVIQPNHSALARIKTVFLG